MKHSFHNIANCIALVSLIASSSQPVLADSPSSTISVYPPTNVAAGSGLLYFPAGGNSSLYAVPIENDPSLITGVNAVSTATANGDAALVNAINAQTTAIKAQTAILTQQVSILQGLATTLGSNASSSSSTSSGSIDYIAYPGSVNCTLNWPFLNPDPGASGKVTSVPIALLFSKLASGTYSYQITGEQAFGTNQNVSDLSVQFVAVYDARSGHLLNAAMSGGINETNTYGQATLSCPASISQ